MKVIMNLRIQRPIMEYWSYIMIELGPLVWVVLSTWLKLMYFNISAGSAWWPPGMSAIDWMRAYPFALSATLGCLLLMVGLLPLFPRKWRFLVLLIFSFMTTSVVVVNLIHVDFYNDVVSVWSYLNATMLPWVFGSVVDLLRPLYVLLFLDVLILLLIAPFYMRTSGQNTLLPRQTMPRLSASFIVLGFLLTLPTLNLYANDTGRSLTHENSPREVASAIGLLPYHIIDLWFYINSKMTLIDQTEIEYALQFMEQRCTRHENHSELFGVAHGRNVILISAESIHGFVLGLEVNGQVITPRLNDLANQSLNFVEFYDQTHLGTTSDGEFTTLQSLHPLPVGAVVSQYNSNEYFGLPAYLVEHGYTTFSAVGAPAEFWSMNKMHPKYGFQQGYYEDFFEITELIGGWLSDKELFRQIMPVIRGKNEPFMAFLLSSSSHHPFELAEEHIVLDLGELDNTLLGSYLHTVHYFDQAIGEFLDELQEAGILDQSVVVIYGDHKTYLGNPTDLVNLFNLDEQSEVQQVLFREKMLFLIRLPNAEGARVNFRAAGHLDVAPTVLSLLGLKDRKCVMLGEDLTLDKNSLVVFRDGSYIDGKHYLVNRFGPAVNSTCYDLEREQRISCEQIQEQRREALERLKVSDLIIRGNLIPNLASSGD